MNIELARKVAIKSVRDAGKILMANLTKVKDCSLKAKSDIVTEIDLKSEKIIISKIKKNFPKHSIHSEEQGLTKKNSKYLWVLDPIDGTMNYYHASSPFRIGLCLVKNGLPIMAVLYNPVRDHLYYAEKGKGAFLNNKKIKVNNNFKLSKSIVMTHISSKKDSRARVLVSLNNIFNKTLHMRIFGSGLAAMTYVASGKFDIFFNISTYPWDILSGALLVQEAGGVVTDIHGEKININSTSVLATNGKVHAEMLNLLEDI